MSKYFILEIIETLSNLQSLNIHQIYNSNSFFCMINNNHKKYLKEKYFYTVKTFNSKTKFILISNIKIFCIQTIMIKR